MPPTLPSVPSPTPPTEPSADPRAGALLRRLEWTVLKRLDGLLRGDHRTLLRGFGLDLADLRDYQYGDDVRHIDWNVTARLDAPHVREFQEDREVCAWFLVDTSPSLDFGFGLPAGGPGGTPRQKRQVAAEFVAVLAHLLSGHGNRVGMLLSGGGAFDAVVPARGGRRHVLHLLQRLLAAPRLDQAPATDLHGMLRGALSVIPRRSLVFVVSDFISATGWTRPLAQLALRHEIVAVRLHDPLESELPDLGWLTMQDAESGEQILVDTHDAGFRRRYARAAAARETAVRDGFAAAGVDALEVGTGDDLAFALLRFADLRRLRARLAAGAALPAHLHPHGGAPGAAVPSSPREAVA